MVRPMKERAFVVNMYGKQLSNEWQLRDDMPASWDEG